MLDVNVGRAARAPRAPGDTRLSVAAVTKPAKRARALCARSALSPAMQWRARLCRTGIADGDRTWSRGHPPPIVRALSTKVIRGSTSPSLR